MFMSFYLAIKYRELHLDYMKFIQDQRKNRKKTQRDIRRAYVAKGKTMTKTFGTIIRNIKAWTRNDEFRIWLYSYTLVQSSDIPTDSDGDVWAYNEVVFLAYTDKNALQRALEETKRRYNFDEDYYREEYKEIRGGD
jgi:hypothetical protein